MTRTRVHVVQDTPTPHNNVLLAALQERPDVELVIWYAGTTHPQYAFSADLAYVVAPPRVYGNRRVSWSLLREALFERRAKWLIVGWVNPTTRLLVPLLSLTRRRFNMWFDLPVEPPTKTRRAVRELYYWLIRHGRARVFAVGEPAVRFFRERGFASADVRNLPILVEIPDDPAQFRGRRAEIRAQHGVSDGDLLIVTGSRLLHEKGFDLLFDAIAALPPAERDRTTVILIGRGEELDALKEQVARLGLSSRVYFYDWMQPEEFLEHLAAADVSVHPARFDAFGGITLSSMLLGVPLIASRGAGAAIDRVEHERNGWLFDPSNVDELSALLLRAHRERERLLDLGSEGRRTAESYAPGRQVESLLRELV